MHDDEHEKVSICVAPGHCRLKGHNAHCLSGMTTSVVVIEKSGTTIENIFLNEESDCETPSTAFALALDDHGRPVVSHHIERPYRT